MNILAARLSSTKNSVSNDSLFACIKHYNSLLKELTNLKGQILSISTDVAQILSEIRKNYNTQRDSRLLTHPEGNHVGKEFVFPLSTIEEFDKFNEKLKDEIYKNKINKRLYFSLNGKHTITRNMGNIIRAYISRDVALSYVAVKTTSKKKVFKDTTFFTSIKTAIRQKFENNQEIIPDSKLHQALSSVLNNAKDWDGYRVARIKKQSSN
ncbi:uncharacterized protein LOC123658311 [Melitaea cinxia]|uniref:uncharacterized protein LOC123658311 n=1 Tax=Melitaea cinxia TaxID=113334 RepID=UPI001E27256B|nr:uncharacterized protein LOC123658311 [Melitaea cinxia]